MFTELPNGVWLDTEQVISIYPRDGGDATGMGDMVPPHVGISTRISGYVSVDFQTPAEAHEWAKAFGTLCRDERAASAARAQAVMEPAHG